MGLVDLRQILDIDVTSLTHIDLRAVRVIRKGERKEPVANGVF